MAKWRAQFWYQALETYNPNDESIREGNTISVGGVDDDECEYMYNHKDETKEKLESYFNHEVVDWNVDDEPFFNGLEDVYCINVTFGKQIEY